MTARGWMSRSARMVACGAVLAVTAVVTATAQSPSATPYDVGLFKWAKTEDVAGFDQDPVLADLVVGPDGRVLLLGAIRQDCTLRPMVWSSDDGRHWSQLEGDLPDGSVAVDGIATDDGFLVVAAMAQGEVGGLIRTAGTFLEPVAYPGGGPIAIERSRVGAHVLDFADGPTVWTSTDGASAWTSATVTNEDAVAHELAVTENGTIVVVGLGHPDGPATPMAWSSRDGGVTWRETALPLEAGSWSVSDLAWTPIGLIARYIDATSSGPKGVNLLSHDGITWATTVATTGRGSIGTAGPEAVIFGEDAAWHSADGVTWTEEWWPTLAGFDVVASLPLPGGPVVAAGIGREAPATVATFLGAPAPQAVPSAPVELASPAP